MYRKIFYTMMLIGLLLGSLTACANKTTPNANMANPASVFCEQNGGKVDIQTDASGNQVGICVFNDGSTCDEWAYFRGECKPGGAAFAPTSEPARIGGDSGNANMANPASVFCEQNGGKLEIQTDASGGQVGMCIFNDGSACEEWAYSRGECKPGGAAFAPTSEPARIGGDSGNANMANPASVFCEQNGGKLEIQTDASGGQVGMCIFNDGSACEEWAYSRGECKPGQAAPDATKEVTLVEDGWKVYEDPDAGFRFEYPADAVISHEGNSSATNITITGPLVNDEHWPMILIDHPSDRAEFQVPEGTDLSQWLAEKFMIIPEQRAGDVQIAGTTALHTRFAGSEQACADDKYFFIHGGQLYEITIGHVGNKEDWDVYNHFLNSFIFMK